MKKVSATTWIDAAPMKVWAIITDLSRYPEWNPLFREAAGDIAVGRRIFLRSYPAGGRPMTLRPTITAVAAGTELGWAARLPGIIGGEHRFELRPGNGGTLVVQSETFRGLLVPFSGKALDRAETSFQALNSALKARAESLLARADPCRQAGPRGQARAACGQARPRPPNYGKLLRNSTW